MLIFQIPGRPFSILVFTISAANSDQYIATRTLYGMAKDGNAPRIFTKCTSRGVPWCVILCPAFPDLITDDDLPDTRQQGGIHLHW
jgi:L-asparagine transporter-like permease